MQVVGNICYSVKCLWQSSHFHSDAILPQATFTRMLLHIRWPLSRCKVRLPFKKSVNVCWVHSIDSERVLAFIQMVVDSWWLPFRSSHQLLFFLTFMYTSSTGGHLSSVWTSIYSSTEICIDCPTTSSQHSLPDARNRGSSIVQIWVMTQHTTWCACTLHTWQ